MTQEQYAEAMDLKELIEKADENIGRLEELKYRMEEITGKYQKFIGIQIAEQFVDTPKPKVSLGAFRELINNEIEAETKRRQIFVEQFEKL